MATPQKYEPSAEYLSIKPDASGNAINGLGETEARRASPMFWHPPDQQPFGAVAQFSRKSTRAHPKVAEKFQEANNHPPLIDVAAERPERSAQDWTQAAEAFALSHEADLFGVTSVKDHYIVDGYDIPEPTVVMLGVAHDYDLLKDMPETPTNPNGVFDVAQQYARGTRAAFALANWIRSQGFMAKAYPGPLASNLLLIPPAIDAGFGELGKHGSIINRTHGSGFRLAGVTTDMPLIETQQDEFGADAFCESCQVCTKACPPEAILNDKQMVRGEKKWYVDFDKCIPFFAENAGCGICIAVCPWTRPGVADNLVMKMARRRRRKTN